MARLKTREQLEQEQIEAAKYALGNVTLDTTRLLLIYARQSTSRQYVTNIYSAMEQRDGLLERAGLLGWVRDEQWILYVENQLAKKTHVSGSLRIDQRPGLQALTEVIESGKASAVLVVSVDRITRDEDLITPTQFANLCKRYHVLIITDDYIFDFNNPNRDDMGRFMNEAIAAKEYVRKQIKGKMLKNRTRKANSGKVANGVAPVGLMLDQSVLDEKGKPYNLTPSPHATRVAWVYKRFREHGAKLPPLLREILDMAKQGKPLFPDHPDIDPKTIRLKRVEGGWTLTSIHGLKYMLTNPAYIGHLAFGRRIVKRNAHPAIVSLDDWQYASEHLADVDLDGNPIPREKGVVRYIQRGSRDIALLHGTRDDRSPLIAGVGRERVYANIGTGDYRMHKNAHLDMPMHTSASIRIVILDKIIEDRVLYWIRQSERNGKQRPVSRPAPHLVVEDLHRMQPSLQAPPKTDLDYSREELARVTRALETSQDVMDSETLREHFASKARLIKRVAELEQLQEQKERMAQKREQMKKDIADASEKWQSWDLEKKREFIGMVTESITMQDLGGSWLCFVIVWSPLMGFVLPLESNRRMVDTCFIHRIAGENWTPAEVDLLGVYFGTATREELMRLFPARPWDNIIRKARAVGLTRNADHRALSFDPRMSLQALKVCRAYGLDATKELIWRQEMRESPMTNDGRNSRLQH